MSKWNWLALIMIAIITILLIFAWPVLATAFELMAFSAGVIAIITVLITAIIVAVYALVKDPNLLNNTFKAVGDLVENVGTGAAKVLGQVTEQVSGGLSRGFGPLLIGGVACVALFLVLRK